MLVRMRKLVVIAGLVLSTTVLTAGQATAERFQLGNLILDVSGGFSPQTLPKHEYAPITLKGGGDISTANGELPPPVTHVEIDFDRNGLLTTRGLPVCRASRIENTTSPGALRACRSAL